MTPYFLALTLMLSSVFFFSSKTEKSRVVTIQRPMVITQERHTPAYFVYQQSHNLVRKKPIEPRQNSVFLSQLSVAPEASQIQISEMKLTKREYAALHQGFGHGRTIASDLTEDAINLAYEKVIYKAAVESPLEYQEEEVPELSPSKKWATIKGKFELVEGVGIVDHFVELKRIEEGFVREAGKIDLRAGTYSIDIESPQGLLVARIRDRHGLIVGTDSQRLINLQSKGSFFEGPFIKVGRPNPLALNPEDKGRSKKIAAAIGAMATLFDGQKSLAEPEEEFTNVSEHSSTIARIFDPSQTYKNLVTVRMAGDKSKTPMFTKKWVDGSVEYVSDFQKIQFKSKTAPVILGKILSDSVALSGARVEIEGLPGVSPVYFDQFMIPSQLATATSPNGFFMFLGLDPGSYRVVAKKGTAILGSQIFVAEDDAAGFQHIETASIPATKIVRGLDAFTATPVEAEIVSSDLDFAVSTLEGAASFRHFSKSNVAELLVKPIDQGYLSLRYVHSGNREFAHAPLVREEWLNEIRKIKLINEFPGTGAIIGFTSGISYSAYLTVEGHKANDVVYFDRAGAIVSEPAKDGGFILFNVPAGPREVVLQESSTERIFSQVFDVKSHQLSATHFLE